MQKSRLLFATLAFSLSACGSPQTIYNIPHTVRSNQSTTLTAEKTPGPLIENRKVSVPRSDFDALADQNQNTRLPNDPVFQSKGKVLVQSPFSTPFEELPFDTWRDLSDHIRYSNETTYEDRQFMNSTYAEGHFNKYINTAFREVRNLYKATPEEMKRFILLDVLVNSLEVEGRTLPYLDIHNPPAERHYKIFPTQAALLMPTFGEAVNYNQSSYDVNYVRWDAYRAARYYQANYSRIFGLIMEHSPSKRDAWRLVHREISSYASR